MKTKPINQNNVNIITLGCSKNLVDSEQIASQLSSNNFNVDFENTKLKNQITIINTCGFIESAKQQSLNTILQYAQLKSDNKIKKLIVTGCLSQRYKDELKQEIPEVDHWYGTLDLPLLLKDLNINYQKELLNRRLLSTPKHYAYLKISEGCNRTCSFCAIPLMRGGHISKPIETIIQEAKFLVSQGVKEIMLIAQELTYYGLDLYKKRALATLLEKLVTIDGLIWIRLHYAYPQNFPLDILEIMQQEPKICKYLDIPLQHASNSMLKSMQRQITQNDIKHLITKIKTKIPNITLRSTFIVGFPNETNQDFNELKSFIQEIKFDRLGVFTYSHEENTKA
ncbi:MAG: 30S ribosomal protein S12 methylthiotransferase RimO, partial [Alphaproteobacteria bacterium]|nr:30S ribosomal protein S12 methylthiotransferase RimO [Alphaproteobacteria bacterium]